MSGVKRKCKFNDSLAKQNTFIKKAKANNGKVPSLYESCTRVLNKNIDAIEFMVEAPYFLLKPVLERCTPLQLFSIEGFNPYLVSETSELWEVHCSRDFRERLLSRQENETWRELYLRAHDEQEKRLKCVTANITASMGKSGPARQVKLAYVDSVVKPPRDVARRQAKNGTAVPVNHTMKAGPSKSTPKPVSPAISSSSSSSGPVIPKTRQVKLAYVDSVVKPPRDVARRQAKNGTAVPVNHTMKAGPSKSTPKPVSPAISSSSSSSGPVIPKKPKVAPLMAKTLKSMKQHFRR